MVPGGRSSSRSRPEAKSAAIVLMSWRKWWEFVKGGSRALEFEKGSKVNLLLLAKAGGLGRGRSRVPCSLPSGPWTSCPRPQAPAKGGAGLRQRLPQGDSERELRDGPATPACPGWRRTPAGPSGLGDSREPHRRDRPATRGPWALRFRNGGQAACSAGSRLQILKPPSAGPLTAWASPQNELVWKSKSFPWLSGQGAWDPTDTQGPKTKVQTITETRCSSGR